MPKIPDGLTIKVTHNTREKTFKILAYRKGEFKRAYRATVPTCDMHTCRKIGPQTTTRMADRRVACSKYHQSDVDALVKKLIKSYI